MSGGAAQPEPVGPRRAAPVGWARRSEDRRKALEPSSAASLRKNGPTVGRAPPTRAGVETTGGLSRTGRVGPSQPATSGPSQCPTPGGQARWYRGSPVVLVV